MKTDMDAHTTTVTFDDEKLELDAVIEVLNEAGYTVPGHEQIE